MLAAMSRIAYLAVVTFTAAPLAATACDRRPAAPTPYAQDVERICNVERLSGALDQDESQRSMTSAMWLASNVQTAEGRELLARQSPLPPPDKAALLRAEAVEVGLASCPTADSWR
jgi:hypothetical protein